MSLSLLILVGLVLVLLALAASGTLGVLRPAASDPVPRILLPALGVILSALGLFGGSSFSGLPLPVGFEGGSGGLELDALSCMFLLLVFLAALFAEWSLDVEHHVLPMHRLRLACIVLTMLAGDVFLLAIGGTLSILMIGRGAGSPGWPRRRVVSVCCLVAACTLLAGAGTPAGALLPDAGFMLLRGETAGIETGFGSVLLPLLVVGATGPLLGLFPWSGWQRRLCVAAPASVPAFASLLGLFLLLRLLLDLAGTAPPGGWGLLLMALGLITSLSAGLRAFAAGRLRAACGGLLALQNGLVVTAVGVCLLARFDDLPTLGTSAFDAAMLLIPIQVLAGLVMLRLARIVEDEAGTTLLGRLGGLATAMPHAAPIVLASVSMLAFMPPAGGFDGLWLLLQSMLAACRLGNAMLSVAGAIGIAGIVVAVAVSVAAWLRLAAIVFLGRPRTPRGAAAQDIPRSLAIASVALLALPLLIGLVPGMWLRLVAQAARLVALSGDADPPPVLALVSPGSGSVLWPLPLALMLLALLGVCLWTVRRLSMRPERREPAWEGGFAPPPAWLPFGDPLTQIGPAAMPSALRVALTGSSSVLLMPFSARFLLRPGHVLGPLLAAGRHASLGLDHMLRHRGAALVLFLLAGTLALCGWWRFS
ncbi:MAG: hypothetical protein ACRYGI_12055 [Janthinobacterium lividum]